MIESMSSFQQLPDIAIEIIGKKLLPADVIKLGVADKRCQDCLKALMACDQFFKENIEKFSGISPDQVPPAIQHFLHTLQNFSTSHLIADNAVRQKLLTWHVLLLNLLQQSPTILNRHLNAAFHHSMDQREHRHENKVHALAQQFIKRSIPVFDTSNSKIGLFLKDLQNLKTLNAVLEKFVIAARQWDVVPPDKKQALKTSLLPWLADASSNTGAVNFLLAKITLLPSFFQQAALSASVEILAAGLNPQQRSKLLHDTLAIVTAKGNCSTTPDGLFALMKRFLPHLRHEDIQPVKNIFSEAIRQTLTRTYRQEAVNSLQIFDDAANRIQLQYGFQ